MKKLAVTLFILAWALVAMAQPKSPAGFAVRGGVMANLHENVRSYFNHQRFGDIFTSGFAVDGMYDFTNLFGVRLSGAIGRNAGACNSQQVGGGFYPYLFRSLNLFADAMLHFGTPYDAFSSRIYAGLGYAHTYGLTQKEIVKMIDGKEEKITGWPHPWEERTGQSIPYSNEPNDVFGFRVGYLGEWHVTPEVGILIDACGEFYTDTYDCLMPNWKEHEPYRGYAGFPFDMRFIVSLGIAYHF